jgi:arabinan endo-1,5-alpha-L-arabinosidase
VAAALGPFTPLAQPLIHDPNMGLIDASEIFAGTPYALWKEDGSAVGKPTPIHAQQMTADGLSLSGSPWTLITNDLLWEGAVVEAPFMVQENGTYYLFYSGNSYATPPTPWGSREPARRRGRSRRPRGPSW